MGYRYGSHTAYKIQYHLFVIFECFPDLKRRDWGHHFWARGYFCVTSGELTEGMIENYLDHHFEPKVDDDFRTEGWAGF